MRKIEKIRKNIWAATWQNQQNGICAQQQLGSAWVDAQADPSLRWVHSHFVGFVMSRLISISIDMGEKKLPF